MILKENQRVNVIVRGIVIEDGELVLTEWKDKSWSFLLGGRIDFGEPILDALHREMREEAEVNIDIVKLAYFSQNVFDHPNGTQFHEYGYYFLVHPERMICPHNQILPNPDSPELIIRRAKLTPEGLSNTWPRFLAKYLPQDVANEFADCPRFLFSRHDVAGNDQTVELPEMGSLFST